MVEVDGIPQIDPASQNGEGGISDEARIQQYLHESLPPTEDRISQPMDSNCLIGYEIPAKRERKFILRPLLSLARQERISPNQIECVVVVNNPADAPKDEIDDNLETMRLIRFINKEDETYEIRDTEEQEAIDKIRRSGIKIFLIDKSSPGKTFEGELANAGSARNRGTAELVARFRSIGRDGIIAHTDADTRFDPNHAINLKRIFDEDPDLIGVTGRTDAEFITSEDEEFLKRPYNWSKLQRNIKVLLRSLQAASAHIADGKPLVEISFSGPNMAARSIATALADGIPRSWGDDRPFGKALSQIGKIAERDEIIAHPGIRPSDRAPFHGAGSSLRKAQKELSGVEVPEIADPLNPEEKIPVDEGVSKLIEITLEKFPQIKEAYEARITELSDENSSDFSLYVRKTQLLKDLLRRL